MIENIASAFTSEFTGTPVIVRSPGRINIIGEHTDYNEGFVLPAAIDKSIYVAVTKRMDDNIHLFSVAFNEHYEVPVADIQPTQNWETYILGVVDQLLKRGCPVTGFNLALNGDIPIGAGLSSSAAVECAVVFALNELFELGINKLEMVLIAQKAEHLFSGVMCGIMDMFVSMFGKKDHVIKLDCRSLEYEYKPLLLDGYRLVLFNSNIKHSLASSAYNERRQQCEQGVAWVQEHYPLIKSLRDTTIPMLDEFVATKDPLVYNRCKYVVEENQRLLSACTDLENGDIASLGQRLFQTHEGLSKLYEVSCPELDFLINSVKTDPALLGARMMGGGFGGCTINIIKENAATSLVKKITGLYKETMHIDLTTYLVNTANGTERL
jgi:galactokinase